MEAKKEEVGPRELGYMRMALAAAEGALCDGEVPVGCVLVLPGARAADAVPSDAGAASVSAADDGGAAAIAGDLVIATGANETNVSLNATRHAELVAIDRVLLGNHEDGGGTRWDANTLRHCELYVTVEPCLMCAAALAEVQIAKVFYGCGNDRFGGCGSILSLHEPGALPPPPMCGSYPCVAGVLADEGVEMLRRFYARGNAKIAKPKRKVVPQPQPQGQAKT